MQLLVVNFNIKFVECYISTVFAVYTEEFRFCFKPASDIPI